MRMENKAQANEDIQSRAHAPDAGATAHTRSRYDLLAPLYDLMEAPVERLRYRAWRRTLWDDVHGPDVLELGVGTGKNIPYYPSGVHVTAVDLSAHMLRRARHVLQNHLGTRATLLEMDIQALDFPNGAFDDVVATFVFCSVPDPVLGLREALRVTRPGGRLHLLEHMRSDTPYLARLMDVADPAIHWLTGVHVARETVQNVQTAGWLIDEVVPLSRGEVFRSIEAHKATDVLV